jgi:dynein heavy chain
MEDLNKAQHTFDEKQAELDVFQAKYDAARISKQALQDDADGCKIL